MRTRYTYVALLTAIAASAMAGIVSCTAESTAPGSTMRADSLVVRQKIDDLRSRYAWVATYHTEGLHYIYLALARAGQIRGKADACRIAARAVKEFHRRTRYSEVPAALVDPAITSEVCGSQEGSTAVRATVLGSSLERGARANELSAPALDHINQVIAAVDVATSRAGLAQSLYSIEYSAAASLPESEAAAVSTVSAIALTSADYWDANLTQWFETTTQQATAYSRVANEGSPFVTSGTTMSSLGPRSWWGNPYVRNYLKIVGADAAGGGRVIATSWMLGPISWDAAAAAALWMSAGAFIALLK